MPSSRVSNTSTNPALRRISLRENMKSFLWGRLWAKRARKRLGVWKEIGLRVCPFRTYFPVLCFCLGFADHLQIICLLYPARWIRLKRVWSTDKQGRLSRNQRSARPGDVITYIANDKIFNRADAPTTCVRSPVCKLAGLNRVAMPYGKWVDLTLLTRNQ